MANPKYDTLSPSRKARFQGTTFQSKSEAKWAAVFHELHIPYVYEPDTYQLPSGKWKPDFWLPEQRVFFEVKPWNHHDPRYVELGASEGALVYLGLATLPVCPVGAPWDTQRALLSQRIWRKWPREAGRSFALAREGSGSFTFAPLAEHMTCDPADPAILMAYQLAVLSQFE